MNNRLKGNIESDDFIGKGFHKLEDRLVEKRPPKINWGEKYQGATDDDKISYLEKLSAAMNHAAHLIQGERNELSKLCALKEEQLIKMQEAVDKNMDMLTTEVTKMNETRQGFNQEVARLNKIIKDLKNGDHNQ
jgi:seryl-tRNA synthetase